MLMKIIYNRGDVQALIHNACDRSNINTYQMDTVEAERSIALSMGNPSSSKPTLGGIAIKVREDGEYVPVCMTMSKNMARALVYNKQIKTHSHILYKIQSVNDLNDVYTDIQTRLKDTNYTINKDSNLWQIELDAEFNDIRHDVSYNLQRYPGSRAMLRFHSTTTYKNETDIIIPIIGCLFLKTAKGFIYINKKDPKPRSEKQETFAKHIRSIFKFSLPVPPKPVKKPNKPNNDVM